MPGGANTWQMEARDTSAGTYCLSHPKCLFWAKPGYSRVSPQPLLRKRRPPPDGFVVFYFPPQAEKGKTKKRNGEERKKEERKRKREGKKRRKRGGEKRRDRMDPWAIGQLQATDRTLTSKCYMYCTATLLSTPVQQQVTALWLPVSEWGCRPAVSQKRLKAGHVL